MKDGTDTAGPMSMTGFAAVQGAHEGWSWSADIRAVNGRTLELRMRLPEVEGLEPELRKRLQARLGRGNVTVNLKLKREEGVARPVLKADGLNAALEVLRGIEAAAGQAGLELAPMRASDIASMRGVVDFAENEAEDDPNVLRAALLESLGDCLDAFVADRAREGAALAEVIGAQIDRIEALTRDAAAAVGDREAAQRAAMKRALERMVETADVPDEARLAQELALIAVKTDVTEELDRLAAHITAARALLTEKGPVGRKFDFLMQEFNREANTLCSKAQSGALTAIGLDLKTVIDQMREQVQNIE